MIAQQTSTCHLLNLPAELRLRIYEEVLSSGVLCLTRTDTKRFAVTPAISPLFLATCRQIYNEANKLLYSDNEVTLIMDVHDTFAPVINESRLQQRALEKLQHVCMICDATSNFQSSYKEVDFTPLSALVSLRSLRICVVLSSRALDSIEASLYQVKAITDQILERVPASAQILYNLETEGAQEKLVQYVMAKAIERHGRSNAGRSFTAITGNAGGSFSRCTVIVKPDQVREAVELAVSEPESRGCKSGGVPDVFAEYHTELKGFAWRS